jgi:hypothetical protein
VKFIDVISTIFGAPFHTDDIGHFVHVKAGGERCPVYMDSHMLKNGQGRGSYLYDCALTRNFGSHMFESFHDRHQSPPRNPWSH